MNFKSRNSYVSTFFIVNTNIICPTSQLTSGIRPFSIETMRMDINDKITLLIKITFKPTFSPMRPRFIFVNPLCPMVMSRFMKRPEFIFNKINPFYESRFCSYAVCIDKIIIVLYQWSGVKKF